MERFNISLKAVSGIERHLKRDSSIRGDLLESMSGHFNIGCLSDHADTDP